MNSQRGSIARRVGEWKHDAGCGDWWILVLELVIFTKMVTPPLAVALPAPVYFFSDAHLGAVSIPDPARQRDHFDRFLDLVLANGRSLVLAGDLFDFWYEWRFVIPKEPFHVLHRLRHLVDQGIQIHFLAGNHDFRLQGFLEAEIGMQIQLNSLSALIGAQRVFIYHGDGILKRDAGYRAMKSVFRSPVAQRIFSWLHPDLAMRIARGTSVTSRTLKQEHPEDDAEYLAFARRKFAEGYDAVVLGHTHRPVEQVDGEKVYVNLGDWITHFSYGLHDGYRLRLESFRS
jgi:UDP-2,3-diacylglucosamine hydrolase